MKILCLGHTIESSVSLLHPKHLLQCHAEIVNTLLFLLGESGGYIKSNANTKAWEGYEGDLFSYLIETGLRMRYLGAKPSSKIVKKAVHIINMESDLKNNTGLPWWFGTKDTIDMHRGWVVYKCKGNKDMAEFYKDYCDSYMPVSRIKVPKKKCTL